MIPGLNKTTLDNGIRIITHRMPHVRSVSMGVWVNVGARDEMSDESGLCHFIEHMIFKGTRKRSAFQIAKEFDAIGGQTNAFTAMETTCYHARVIDAHLDTMVDILSDIFLNSVFAPEEVERERPVIIQEIGMVEDNPEEFIHILTGRTYWGEHALGRSILGPRENVSRFDAEKIKEFFRHLYQPDRIVIAVSGNIEHDPFVDLVGTAFESIPPGNGLPERHAPHSISGVTVFGRDIEQVHVCLAAPGLSITDPRRYAYSLINTILGGNMSSRLFQEIREKRSLAYAVYAFMSSYVDAGMFGVYAGVDPQQAPAAVELMLKELGRLKAEAVAPSELGDAKEFLKGSLLLACESVDNQMVRLAQNELHFDRYIPLQEVVDRIEQITADDITDLARDLFRTDRLALTLLGPVADDTSLSDMLKV